MNADETIYIVEAEMNRTLQRVKKIEKKAEMTEAEKIRVGEVYQFHKHVKRLIEVYNRDRAIAFGKRPPHAEELERAILGAMMMHSRKVYVEGDKLSPMTESLERIKKFLQPDHFYKEVHSLIYKAIIALEEPDVESVYRYLRKEGLSDQVGGPAFIAGLTSGVVSGYQELNARVVMEYAIKRRVISIGFDFSEGGYDDTTDALELIESARKQIEDTIAWIK